MIKCHCCVRGSFLEAAKRTCYCRSFKGFHFFYIFISFLAIFLENQHLEDVKFLQSDGKDLCTL